MKHLTGILVVFLLAFSSYSQTDSARANWAASVLSGSKAATPEQKARISKFNFGPLWTRPNDNGSVLGYIGDDYQRLRIIILSATKDPKLPDTYNVTGKSMVKNVVREFSGIIRITKVSFTSSAELDEEYKSAGAKEAGFVFGEYHFSEDAKQTSTGSFDGNFVTNWYVDRNGRFQYDEVLGGADGYSNNQFAGTWTSYRNKLSKPASWGDSRIPISGDLDIGAGEFSPDQKYVRNGWQSYWNAYFKQDKRALMEERRKWWN